MSDNRCKWESKNHAYDCYEPTMLHDSNSYCILHSKKDDKDLQEFTQKVKERMRRPEEVNLRGCYFPKGFDSNYFRGHTFNKPVSLYEATFKHEVDFSGTKFLERADYSEAQFLQEANG